jgi:4-hydroxy-3-methylbut-2-enyl diphosphate reductase
MVDCAERIERSWFERARTVGITAGASAPEVLVTEVLAKFRSWWPEMIEESIGEPESLHFRMPSGLSGQENASADGFIATQ